MAKGVRNYMHPVFAIITTPEIVIVGALILVLFGAERLPKLARSMGQAKKEFEAAAHNWRGDSASQTPAGQAGPPQPPAPSQPSTPPNPPPPASQ
jgi:sec-independent protein translocase protein TatA